MSECLVLGDVPVSTWDDFHAGRTAGVGSELVSCWSRAKQLGAPPDGAPPEDRLIRGEALRLHAGHVELIEAIGDTILDRATARVADHDFVLLLADPDGIVVRAGGGGEFTETASRLKLIAGSNWSEAARGTNAIGTTVAANRPTEVHGHAHWGRSYHDIVCYAAPVRGIDGLPFAVLDATSWIERADPAVARTVLDAARALEELLRLQAYASAGVSVTRVLGRSVDRIRDPALLLEVPGTIMRANAAAHALLGSELAGRDAREAFALDWHGLVCEALAPTPGGLPIVVGQGVARRTWRLRVDPVAAPTGSVIAIVVVLEPARAPSRARAATDPFAPIFAEDAGVVASIEWARRLAASELPVMLLADTGAGKELFAQAIHASSPRAAGPWHAVNCGALAPSLLETELFGYAPGAFTGAERAGRAGLFQAAQGGTVFLDEIAEMSPAMQAALLRVVDTGTYRRVGDTRLARTDVRILCATCRDLPALVAAGRFREDLYYRLKGGTVKIPSLHARTDVLALASHLLAGRAVLSSAAAAAIAAYPWPGNVRELKSVLGVALVASAGADQLELSHLPAELTSPGLPPSALDDVQREALVRALAESAGNVSCAARRLGVARSTLHRMKRRHGLR